MRVTKLILENFRRYKDRHEISLDDFTAILGRNDVGKSTILEALDIFFEGGVVKMDRRDASVDGDPRNVRIAVAFGDIPEQLTLDSGAQSTLGADYLLNESGELEVHKVFSCTSDSPKPKIHARAHHPTAEAVADLLQKKNAELKRMVRDQGLADQCDQTENPSMRRALYGAAGDLQLESQDVPLNDENGRAVWTALQKYMPVFALFQSDRQSTDKDPEAQNPLKAAIDQALAELQENLDEISEQVRARATDTARRTIDKLQESYPDLARELTPDFGKPGWKKAFSIDLTSDQGVPLNKRGSGVRRLILLSFFQAEAERKSRNPEDATGYRRPVFYAIEEPETSQHPDSQKRIIQALLDLTEVGDQVLITTHVPGLAALIPVQSVRLLLWDEDAESMSINIGGDDPVLEEVVQTLGILPDPVVHNSFPDPAERHDLKVAVLMEGKNDIDALRSMTAVLAAANDIPEFDEGRVFWALGGGDSIGDWVQRRYLSRLGLPQVVIFDSDRDGAEAPIKRHKQERLNTINAQEAVEGFMTRKRNMDNYVHPEALARLAGIALNIPANANIDFHKMDEILKTQIANLRDHGVRLRFEDDEGNQIPGRSIKQVISCCLMRQMTADEIKARSEYQDDQGAERHEVLDWLNAIQAHLNN